MAFIWFVLLTVLQYVKDAFWFRGRFSGRALIGLNLMRARGGVEYGPVHLHGDQEIVDECSNFDLTVGSGSKKLVAELLLARFFSD